MAKMTSLTGKIVGKVGSLVFCNVGGQTIAREYNPNVSNPSTQPQVDQRAKMKLMSQVAAAMAPVLAIPKEGLKSSRNLFIKKNFDACSASNGVAQVTYENLQITKGVAGLPGIHVTRSVEDGIEVELRSAADGAVSRVVYVLYVKTSEATLQYVTSIIVSVPGDDGKFAGSLPYTTGDVVLFAYGMKDLSARATAKYQDYEVENGLDIAKLSLTRQINTSDFQFTMTRGITLFADENEAGAIGENQAQVFVTAGSGGTVSGAGVYNIGDSVTVVATPGVGYSFYAWRINGSAEVVSNNASYTFTLESQVDLIAEFSEAGQN